MEKLHTFREPKQLQNLSASNIRAFDQKVSGIPGIIKLTIGEPDLATPDHIKKAAIRDINDDDSHYAPQAGKPQLLKAISCYLDRSIRSRTAAEVGTADGAERSAGYGRQGQQRTGGRWCHRCQKLPSLCTGQIKSTGCAWHSR